MKTSDEQIVSAVLTCRTNAEVAEKCGLSEPQLYARMREKSFRKMYNEANTELLNRVADSVRLKMLSALDVVSEVMNNSETPAQVRLNAANAILKNCAGIIQLSNLARNKEESDDIELW